MENKKLKNIMAIRSYRKWLIEAKGLSLASEIKCQGLSIYIKTTQTMMIL